MLRPHGGASDTVCTRLLSLEKPRGRGRGRSLVPDGLHLNLCFRVLQKNRTNVGLGGEVGKEREKRDFKESAGTVNCEVWQV